MNYYNINNVVVFCFRKPNVMKQKNAFPPNFIHSLDSSHMMLTSLHCERAGITFVSVHDCYWTHPSTANIMNKVCIRMILNIFNIEYVYWETNKCVSVNIPIFLENISLFLAFLYFWNICYSHGTYGFVLIQGVSEFMRKILKT